MDQAQRAQGFDKVQFTRIECMEILVTCQHVGELPGLT